MGFVPVALLAVGFFAGDSSAKPLISPSSFKEWFDDACEGRLHIPDAVEQRAQRFRYVFVGGFQNELKPGYFAQNIKELKEHGVSRKLIHEIYPSSRKTIDESLDEIRGQFLDAAKLGPERLVIIAHSRGACDTLAFALENAEFVRDHVDFLFLVQGPFGGTPLADYVLKEGKPIDNQLSRKHRVLGRLSGKVERSLYKRGTHAGMSSLTSKASQAFWERMLDEYADAIPIVGPKTYYLTSQIHPDELYFIQGATGDYLHTYYGPNDGVVPVADQFLLELGSLLGVLDVAHADLTQKYPSSHAPRQFRRALIQSILMAVGQKRTELAPETAAR